MYLPSAADDLGRPASDGMADASPSKMPLPFAVIFVPPFDVSIMPFIFMCLTSVFTAPSPSASSLHSASLLARPRTCINCSATKTCTAPNERSLLGAYLLATFSIALTYVCTLFVALTGIYFARPGWINRPVGQTISLFI